MSENPTTDSPTGGGRGSVGKGVHMSGFRRWLAIKRYRWAFFWHAVREPTLPKTIYDPLFDKSIGETREQRDKNLGLLFDRWMERGPKPEDYGLTAEDVKSEHATWMP